MSVQIPQDDTAAESSASLQVNPAYQLMMLFFSVYAVASLAVVLVLPPTAPEVVVIDLLDPAICTLFLVDFLLSLYTAPSRWRYFRTWGWLDLASSIPMFDFLRAARLARVARGIRVLRAIRASTMLYRFVSSHRSESVAASLTVVFFLLVAGSSMAVLHFEAEGGGNIKSAGDAIWWAIATVTTAGYGDVYPVTMEGRTVATLLMVAGIGVFGTLSGLIAAWLLGGKPRD